MKRIFDENCLVEDSDVSSDSSAENETLQKANVASEGELIKVRGLIENDFDDDIDGQLTFKLRNKILKKRKIAQKTTIKNR